MPTDDIPPNTPISVSLLGRYLAGTSTAEEWARVEQWRRGAPLRDVMLDALHTRALHPEANIDDVELAWRQIHARTGADELVPADQPSWGDQDRDARRTRRAPAKPRWRGAALAAVVAVLLCFVVPSGYHVFRARHSAATSRQYTAGIGQRTTVTLDDGSRIVLAPETHLQYTVDRANVRTVELIGEAFFTVSSRANAPFVVRTGGVRTRVLGTTFDVRYYPGDAAAQVAVLSGRVATGGARSSAILAAGHVGQVTDSSVVVNPSDDPSRVAAWTDGRLIFRNTPVPVMLATLGRWYGYEFHLADSTLAGRHVSIGFSTDEPAEAMNMVKVVLGVTMTFDGHVVTLRPEHMPGSKQKTQRISTMLDTSEPEAGK